MNSIISVEGLAKHFQSFTLGPLEFKQEQGTVVALVGPNGSGKSTFFQLLMNVLQPNVGQIKLFNQNRKDDTIAKQKIGFVGDQMEPFAHLKIKEIASFISHWYPSWNEERYQQLLRRYEINENMTLQRCSKGTQKKFEFVVALAYKPDLLMLDEPSTGLDFISRRKMIEDLQYFLASNDTSVLLATHNLEDIKQIADYICVMDKGKIIQFTEKDELHHNWARLWVPSLPEQFESHPNVLHIDMNPLQIVTNNHELLSRHLSDHGIVISHSSTLALDEIVPYLIRSHSSTKETG
ncbi:ATP-binding cassette domain-containing protein [Halalkalibacter akibai]|uniref:ABC-type multidrug transport system n=1 Tax=Halalkalibacter akibai (strain ATCC 43226 / DSM 21942 / CIP 109018 / JCM 9157 / 1139) TaxID=1236973 RepID=W4QYH0_HALA3|nr:ABC transporter ATP-binding protein [Halalkalibacter akibai]GAE36927.1 ABC-type multidrug transport system [Halalkalibacter akibai JCM 9157]